MINDMNEVDMTNSYVTDAPGGLFISSFWWFIIFAEKCKQFQNCVLVLAFFSDVLTFQTD